MSINNRLNSTSPEGSLTLGNSVIGKKKSFYIISCYKRYV